MVGHGEPRSNSGGLEGKSTRPALLLIWIYWIYIGAGLPVSAGGSAIVREEERLRKAYQFSEWGGRVRGPAVFHHSLSASDLLGPGWDMVTVEEYREVQPLGAPWAIYVVLCFHQSDDKPASDQRTEPREPTVYELRLYECESVMAAHKLLMRTSTYRGATYLKPPAPRMKGVDVGDRCFTPVFGDQQPSVICFARGNIVIDVNSERQGISVLDLARMIDERLCMSRLTARARLIRDPSDYVTTEVHDGQHVGPSKPLPVSAREGKAGAPVRIVPKLRGSRKRVSVVASKGDLRIDEAGDLVLVVDKPGEVSVSIVSREALVIGEDGK